MYFIFMLSVISLGKYDVLNITQYYEIFMNICFEIFKHNIKVY